MKTHKRLQRPQGVPIIPHLPLIVFWCAMPELHVRCLLCSQWWSVSPEALRAPLRCTKCGAAFSAGGRPADHPEPLPQVQVLKGRPGTRPELTLCSPKRAVG